MKTRNMSEILCKYINLSNTIKFCSIYVNKINVNFFSML